MKAKQVLVVDDDRDVRAAVRAVLEDAGYAVAEAANGHQALALLSDGAEHPRIILLDLVMPDMDGIAFIAALSQLPVAAAVSVIVLSSHPQMRKLVSNLKVARCLKKPVRRHDLINAVAGLAQA